MENCSTCMKHEESKHFVVFLMGNYMEQLSIPKKIAEHLNKRNSHNYELEVPTGKKWPIQLRKDGKQLFFGIGWSAFVRENNLVETDFLHISWVGNSCFKVQLFSSSGCEKTDSYGSCDYEKRRLQDNERNNEELECSSSSKFKEKQLSDCQRGAKPSRCLRRRKAISSSISARSNRSNNIQSVENEEHLLKFEKANKRKSYAMVFLSKRRKVTEEERVEARHLAENFKTSKPSFVQVLTPSCVYRAFILEIKGRSFSRTNLPQVKQQAILRVPEKEKEWEVGYYYYARGPRLQGPAWSNFVFDNNLEEGDACVFEIVRKDSLAMNVHIFRVVKELVPLVPQVN